MMGWWVIQTDRGFWVEQSKTEPSTAVRGPYETYGEALDAMYREEQRPEKVLLFAYVAIVLGVAFGFGWWALQ